MIHWCVIAYRAGITGAWADMEVAALSKQVARKYELFLFTDDIYF